MSSSATSFLEVANKAAKFKVYLCARDVFRETFVLFLRQIVVEQHIKERQQSDSDDPLNRRTIVVTEQNINDANATVKRLGDQWIHCLQESYQVDAEEAVRDALSRGNFFVSDPNDLNTTSSSVMDNGSCDHTDGEETNNSLSVDLTQPSTETTDDICGLYAMAKKRLHDAATTSHTDSDNPTAGVPYWHPLPGRTAANGLYVPKTSILPESVTNQYSCYKTVTGIFGLPKPYLKPWDEDQWCQSFIRKLDQQHQGNSQLPYSWNMVQKLTKAIPERLHSTAKRKARHNRGDIIEIVPKSIISCRGNENHSCSSLVDSHANNNNNDHNEDGESTTNSVDSSNVLQRKNHSEEEEHKEEEPILLGSTKFQERFAIKKRRRKRIREEELALQQETNDIGRNNSNATTNSINNHNNLLFREDEVRQPSVLPEPLLLHWSDLDDDDDLHNGERDTSHSDETVWHTLQGALKNVGLFHETIQGMTDRGEDTRNDSRNRLASCNGKEGKKLRKERLGKLDKTSTVAGANMSDHINGSKKRGQSASSKVLRVVRKGEEWMEIDLGECLLQFDMETLEAGAIDTSSTSTLGGRPRNPRYRLYAFRSLEISASLGD